MMNISTVENAVEALGGIAAVAEMTNSSPSAVYNWRAADKFPADTYLLVQSELRARGLVAPDNLWPMRQSASQDDDKTKRIRTAR